MAPVHVDPRLAVARRWPWVADAAVVVASAAVSFGWLAHHRGLGTPAWVLSAGLVAPLVVVRRRPQVAFAVDAVVALAQWVVGVPLLADVCLLAGLFAIACRRPRTEGVA